MYQRVDNKIPHCVFGNYVTIQLPGFEIVSPYMSADFLF